VRELCESNKRLTQSKVRLLENEKIQDADETVRSVLQQLNVTEVDSRLCLDDLGP